MKLRTIAIVLIIILLGFVIYLGIKDDDSGMGILAKNNIENINTDLLQVQAKVKVIKEQSVVNDDENFLKGEKIKDNENEEVSFLLGELKENGVISEEEEHFDKYYVWDSDLLEELNLGNSVANNDKIIVNYETLEVILPNGVQVEKDSDVTYKFNEIDVE